MKVGYIIVSNEVMLGGKDLGYLYREQPDGVNDSGWRAFSGEETDEYLSEADNFALYNASTIVSKFPDLIAILNENFPVEYELDEETKSLVKVES